MSPLDELHWARLTATPPSLPDTDRETPAHRVQPDSGGHVKRSLAEEANAHHPSAQSGQCEASTSSAMQPDAPASSPDRRLHSTKWSHPFVWMTLSLALIILVLQVPKGSLPALTSRQRELRAKERLVDAKLRQLHDLSYLLPPRPESLIGGSSPLAPLSGANERSGAVPPQLARNTRDRTLLHSFTSWSRVSAEASDDRTESDSKLWWFVEHLPEGLRVLMRKTTTDRGSEFWMLDSGGPSRKTEGGRDPLILALARSFLERDRLLRQLSSAEARLEASADQHAPTPPATPGDAQPGQGEPSQSEDPRGSTQPEANQ